MSPVDGNDGPRPYDIVSSKTVWSSPWYKIRRDEIRLPDGQAAEYNVVEKGEAVIVVPLTAAGEVVLIRVYRHTTDRWCWEVPAGGVKPQQSHIEAAQEELHEEVGGTADRLTHLGQFYSMNGISNELCHYYVAEGVSLGEMAHEPLEMITRHVRPWAEVREMVKRGEIIDSLSVLALLLTEAFFADRS